MKKEILESVKAAFESNNAESFFATQDGQCFERENDARAHGMTLNKQVPFVEVTAKGFQKELAVYFEEAAPLAETDVEGTPAKTAAKKK